MKLTIYQNENGTIEFQNIYATNEEVVVVESAEELYSFVKSTVKTAKAFEGTASEQKNHFKESPDQEV